jgi:hypothetical protein
MTSNPATPRGYRLMSPTTVTPALTAWAVQILHSPVEYPMFATATRVFGARQVLARVEWHDPDFQNNAVHPPNPNLTSKKGNKHVPAIQRRQRAPVQRAHRHRDRQLLDRARLSARVRKQVARRSPFQSWREGADRVRRFVRVCRHWDFDALSVLFGKPSSQLWGHIVTGAIIAGGSKASLVLFHNVIGAMSSAEAERRAARPNAVREGSERAPQAQ